MEVGRRSGKITDRSGASKPARREEPREPLQVGIDRSSERLAPFEGLARLVIKHRAALGLSQEELARRVGTGHSAFSRIESGRHKTSVETLQRLAQALGVRLILGLESGPRERPTRELISA